MQQQQEKRENRVSNSKSRAQNAEACQEGGEKMKILLPADDG